QDAQAKLVTGNFEWNERGTVVTFVPQQQLARDTALTLTLAGQTARSLGGAPLGTDTQASYVTYKTFAFERANIPENGVRSLSDGIFLYFSAPLPDEIPPEIRQQITLTPENPDWDVFVDGQKLQVSIPFSPGQTYTVTLPPSLTDQWGQPLGREVRFTFREPDAIPIIEYGFTDALRTSPDSPRLSIRAVNIQTMLLSRGTLSLQQFISWMSNYQARENIVPADLRRWEIRPNLPRNVNQPVEINLSDTPLAPGIYLVAATSPELKYPREQKQVILASYVNVTVKSSNREILVWAMDTRTLTPVSNTAVQVFAENGEAILQGVTDSQGLWRSPLPENRTVQLVILGQPGQETFGAASPEWNSGIAPYEFGYRYSSQAQSPFAYIYSDRPIYRPGDVVYFRGALREKFDGRYTTLPTNVLIARINDYNTNTDIYNQKLSISDFGTFSGQVALPRSLAPGNYTLNVTLPDNQELQGGFLEIQVADYRKPEINLSAQLQPSPAQSGQPLTAVVRAEYFFGAPATDLPFEWRLYSQPANFSLSNYQTGEYAERWLSLTNPYRGMYQSGVGRTDSAGRFTIPLETITVSNTTQLTLEITATESGGLPVSTRTSVTIHPDSFYIGIRPQVWFGQAGTPLSFDLLTADWQQAPLSKPLTLEFKRVRWERADIPFETRLVPVYETGETQNIRTDGQGRAQAVFTPPSAGTYLLEAFSGAAKTQVLVWVGGQQNAPWPNLPYDQLRLSADKQEYTPGQTAEVFIPNPFGQEIPMLLSTERGTIKNAQILTLPAEGYRWKVTLTEEDAPNIYVAVTALGPDGTFRQGYLNLNVDPSALTLQIDVKASPTKAGPGETITLDLTVTDQKGQPVQGEFSLSVVDLAVLALAPPNSPDIIPAFYRTQPLNVRTGLTAAIDTRRFSQAGGLGGGGGGGDEVITIREDFRDTAYWNAAIVTDLQGKARISLTLPDNLTTWQVETRGLTKDTKVGQARIQVVTTKDLLIRPQTPRFLVVGDIAELAAIVNNTTNQPLLTKVSLKADGFQLQEGVQAEQTVTIPAQGRSRIAWRGIVQDVTVIEPVFTVKSDQFQDAARPTDGNIPVLRYTAPHTFSTAGILTETNSTLTEIIALPRTFQPLGGELTLELSPSLASAMLSALEARSLPEPAFSTEQILSYLLPNTVTYLTLQSVGVENTGLRTRLESDILVQTNRLLAAQQADGGWGWGLSATRSDPYITAYIIFGLEKVRQSGLVDENTLLSVIQRGRDYLFRTAEPFTGKANLNDPAQANRAAFYLFALQETGSLNTFNYLAEQLYSERERLDPWAKAMLAVTLSRLNPSDERSRTLFSDIEASALRSATGAHWESTQSGWFTPASPLYTSAVVLYTLTERDPASPLAADAVRYLATQRGPQGWASDYENAWVMLALNRFMAATGEFRADFGFSAALNGVNIAQGQAAGPQTLTTINASTPLGQLSPNGANLLTLNRQSGVGRLYYRAALKVLRPVESVPALDKGISILREYLQCEGSNCQPVTSYKVSEEKAARLTVRVTITIPHDVYYLVVEDFIPAGAEILDPSLQTSQQSEQSLSAERLVDAANPFSQGWGWWFFSRPQIYRERIVWNAEYLPAGTYMLTYTIIPSLPGEYRVLPAHAWLAYFPEVQGTTSGALFLIER
ncbi:MAG: hypothetical protein DDG60_12990, partial [Anaerolineae bacterium]